MLGSNIRQSNSLWEPSNVFMKKKNGSLWFYVDNRPLIAGMVRDANPLSQAKK